MEWMNNSKILKFSCEYAPFCMAFVAPSRKKKLVRNSVALVVKSTMGHNIL